MASLTTYLDFPVSWSTRLMVALRSVAKLLLKNPRALVRSLNVFAYGADAWSLKYLCWLGPLADFDADVVHCHFGPIADTYRVLSDILGIHHPWVTSLYGYDVSQVPGQKGRDVYRELARSCDRFFVMSEDMRHRVVALGFPKEKVIVHPVGIDTDSVPFHERTDHADPVKLVSVARLVEKKGIDDLIRALAYARQHASRVLTCTVVGDGPLREQLHALAAELDVDDMIRWTGYMQQEEMLNELAAGDIYVQPSKTSQTGDME